MSALFLYKKLYIFLYNLLTNKKDRRTMQV